MAAEGTTPSLGTSLSWQSLNVVIQVVLQLAYISLLARWLDPEDFGIMAIALVVVGVVEIFAQVGIGPSIVQKPDLSPLHISSAWWFSAGLGLVFFAGMYVAAPALGQHYDTPELRRVLRWISLSFVISGASVVSRSLLIKRMDFRALTLCALAGMVVGNLGVGLFLAWRGAGLWAYVAALLTQNAVLSLGYLWLAPAPVRLGLKRHALRSLIGYGTRSTVFNVLTYAASKLDMVLVKENLGWREVGWYDRAVYLMGLPVTVLGKLGDSVLFSGLSAMQADPEQLRQSTLRGLHFIALLTLPLSAGLAWHADGVTTLLLGAKFADAAPVASVLFVAVAFRGTTKLADATMRALDGLNAGIAIKVAFLGALAGGVVWALDQGWGATGAAWAVVAASALQWLLSMAWMMARLSLNLADVGTSMGPAAALAAVVCLPLALFADWHWLASTAAAAFLGLATALCLPALSVPRRLDPDGTLRGAVARRLPWTTLRTLWSNPK